MKTVGLFCSLSSKRVRKFGESDPMESEKGKITKFLKLPFQFSVDKLTRDLESALSKRWIAHFNTEGYDGAWNSLPLYAPNGNSKNIFALSDSDPIIPTEELENCPYFKEVIQQFECPLLSVRLLRLAVGAKIKPHRDYKLGYEDNCFRLHIPISTNPEVTFTLDDTNLKMLPGECWYTNVNYVHSVSNLGEEDRIHLVIDGERNAWSDELFFSLAPEESFGPEPAPKASREEILRTIEELERMKSPASQQLIMDLQKKLDEC